MLPPLFSLTGSRYDEGDEASYFDELKNQMNEQTQVSWSITNVTTTANMRCPDQPLGSVVSAQDEGSSPDSVTRVWPPQ